VLLGLTGIEHLSDVGETGDQLGHEAVAVGHRARRRLPNAALDLSTLGFEGSEPGPDWQIVRPGGQRSDEAPNLCLGLAQPALE
jgi:hypothetical protein